MPGNDETLEMLDYGIELLAGELPGLIETVIASRNPVMPCLSVDATIVN